MPSQGYIDKTLEETLRLKNYLENDFMPTLLRGMEFVQKREVGNFDPNSVSTEIDANDLLNHATSLEYGKAIDAIKEIANDSRVMTVARS